MTNPAKRVVIVTITEADDYVPTYGYAWGIDKTVRLYPGFEVGAAYAFPECAVRAGRVLYRHECLGEVWDPPAIDGIPNAHARDLR
jgi:hypothetical protein